MTIYGKSYHTLIIDELYAQVLRPAVLRTIEHIKQKSTAQHYARAGYLKVKKGRDKLVGAAPKMPR